MTSLVVYFDFNLIIRNMGVCCSHKAEMVSDMGVNVEKNRLKRRPIGDNYSDNWAKLTVPNRC